MSKKDIFGDDVVEKPTTDFASLFERSLAQGTKKLKVGDSFTGEILSISKEQAFVATGTPQDGILLSKDFRDAEGKDLYKVGDRVDVYVTRLFKDEIFLTRKGATASAEFENLEDAFDMELPIEGRVLEVVKGGFRIEIMKSRAFCPISQMDRKVVGDGSDYVGKKFEFLITQFENNGRNIVVSRKKVLELSRASQEGDWLNSNQVGDILPGKVTRLETFGAFVELDSGVEGLVHLSELGWSRVKHPSEVLKIGDQVQVKILKIDEEETRLKVSMSIKQAGGLGDPWLQILTQFPVGTRAPGTIEKKESFGLFVNIAPGITGLLPKSAWRDSADAQAIENKKKGDTIPVEVATIQFEEKRLSFRLQGEGIDDSWREHQQKQQSGFGSMGALFQNLKKN